MYNIVELSKYIINKCMELNEPIGNLQLQKILYSIQKAYVKKGKIAFEENIEAWQLGPIIPEIYYKFHHYGFMPITERYTVTLSESRLIDEIIEDKLKLSSLELIEEVRYSGGAWHKTYKNGLGTRDVIPLKKIKKDK